MRDSTICTIATRATKRCRSSHSRRIHQQFEARGRDFFSTGAQTQNGSVCSCHAKATQIHSSSIEIDNGSIAFLIPDNPSKNALLVYVNLTQPDAESLAIRHLRIERYCLDLVTVSETTSSDWSTRDDHRYASSLGTFKGR